MANHDHPDSQEYLSFGPDHTFCPIEDNPFVTHYPSMSIGNIPRDEYEDMCVRAADNASYTDDPIWFGMKDATAYMDIHVCGRKAIGDMERNGIPLTDIQSAPYYWHGVRGNSPFVLNNNANWWGLYFSPMIDLYNDGGYPKVWVRFPDEPKPVWFSITGCEPDGRLVLEPNRRYRTGLKKIESYGTEFWDLLTSYPEDISYARTEAEDYFRRENIQRKDKSDVDFRTSFIFVPKPKYKRRRGRFLDTIGYRSF